MSNTDDVGTRNLFRRAGMNFWSLLIERRAAPFPKPPGSHYNATYETDGICRNQCNKLPHEPVQPGFGRGRASTGDAPVVGHCSGSLRLIDLAGGSG